MSSKANIQLLKLAAIFVTVLFSHHLFAAQALPEFKSRYAIQKYGMDLAEAHYQLSYTESGYKFTQNTKLIGFASIFADDTVSAVSYIDEVGDELLLQKYNYTQTGRKNNKDENLSIQWDTSSTPVKGKITGTVRSKKIKLETDTAIWEALSFQIPLMIEANKNKKEYQYKAIFKGKIDAYNFVLTSSKIISFADKKYQALQMVSTDPHKDKNREIHIWLAPKLHNMPVIIEHYRDGKEHSRMQLESVQFNNGQILSDQIMDDDDDF